jgi:hypothetical protein
VPAEARDVPRVRISTAIMAHPRRIDAARRLRDTLGELAPCIVTDPEPDGPPTALRTARLAWAASSADATHHLVLQDDARPVRGFAEALTAAVTARPTHAVSLFTECGSRSSYAVRLAALTGRAWAPTLDAYTPSVGLVLPVEHARGFTDSAEARDARPDDAQDDVRIGRYLYAAGVPGCVPVWNLIEHEGPDSLVGNEHLGPRRSVCFAAEAEAGESPSPEAELGHIPYFDLEHARPACSVASPSAGRRAARPYDEFLSSHGLAPDRIAAAARQALRDRGHAASHPVLIGLWMVAFGLGLQARREIGPSISSDECLRRRAADRSLSTLSDGALHWFLRAHAEAVARWFDPIVLAAVRAGLEVGG